MGDLNHRLARLEAREKRTQPAYYPPAPEQEVAIVAAEQAFMKADKEGRGETALQEADAAYLRALKVDGRRW